MATDKILCVTDSSPSSGFEALREKNLDLVFANGLAQASELLKTQPFDILICDVSHLSLLHTAKKEQDFLQVILLAEKQETSLALEGMRLGAFTYLFKPLQKELLEAALEKAQEQAALIQENLFLRQEI